MLKESFLHSCQNWLKTPQMIPFFVVFLGFNNFLALTASGNYLKSLLKQNPTVVCGHRYKLNQVVQLAMGWTDSHLHQFIIDGEYYSIPSPDDFEPVIDERRFTLSQIAPDEKRRFIYEYDFGDSWSHEIL